MLDRGGARALSQFTSSEGQLRYAIIGGTGLIGRAVATALRARNDDVVIVSRTPGPGRVQWDPMKGLRRPTELDGCEVVFNFSGAPMAARPWTKGRRKVLHDSRVKATEALLASLEELDAPPRVFIGTSNLGLFGDRGDHRITDDAPPAGGFLSDLCVAWEHANLGAEGLGSRVAVLRMSVVLSPYGGAFPLMVRPFHYIGGWLGNGQQYTPWISVRDCVGALLHLADNETSTGVYNGTVPEPTRNREWLGALGKVMGVPVVTHAPKWALRGAFGELADEIFLASVRAVPTRLLAEGYQFVDTDAEATFRWMVTQLEAVEKGPTRSLPPHRR